MPRNAKRRRERKIRYQTPIATTADARDGERVMEFPAEFRCPACGAPPEGALLSEEIEVAELEVIPGGGVRYTGDVEYGEREPRADNGGMLLLCSGCGAEYDAPAAITGQPPAGP